MRRREFMTVLGGAATWPFAACAQQPATPVIGFLHSGAASSFAHLIAALRQGLKETGYIEGSNLLIEYRWAEGRYERLPELAAELASRPVAVLIACAEAPAIAAKTATATVPIVFNTGSDPVKLGLVTSLARPGGNATGVNIFTAEVAAKRLGLLHEVVPANSPMAHLVNPNFPATEANVGEVEAAARLLGRDIVILRASSDSQIDTAFAAIERVQAGGILIGVDPFFNSRREHIISLAARYAIPAAYEQREFVAAGGLMSYGTSLTDAFRQQGIYAGRILNGEKPAELPVIQATKFELVINLGTAKVLGIAIPPTLLARADEVIE